MLYLPLIQKEQIKEKFYKELLTTTLLLIFQKERPIT